MFPNGYGQVNEKSGCFSWRAYDLQYAMPNAFRRQQVSCFHFANDGMMEGSLNPACRLSFPVDSPRSFGDHPCRGNVELSMVCIYRIAFYITSKHQVSCTDKLQPKKCASTQSTYLVFTLIFYRPARQSEKARPLTTTVSK